MSGLLRVGLAAMVCALAVGPLYGQVSVYSVVGMGFPGEPVGVRARSLGGGVAAFDPRSALNPAAVTSFRTLTAVATSHVTRRRYEINGTEVTGLRETRFPFGVVGGNIPGVPLSFAASFSTYMDRTYDLTIRDTVTLRGEDVAFADRLRSRGAVVDSRLALGWTVASRLSLGVGVHVLSGSARVTAARVFSDTSYAIFSQRMEEGFAGFGISAGVVADPFRRLRVGGSVRVSTGLAITRDSEDAGSVDLPLEASGGLLLVLHPAVRWSASAVWRSWSRTADFVEASAFDTWMVGSGIELGSAAAPIRLGFRYAQLPYSPTDEQPREISLALGTGLRFAANRAQADVALERTLRDGAGVAERVWQLSFALVLQP